MSLRERERERERREIEGGRSSKYFSYECHVGDARLEVEAGQVQALQRVLILHDPDVERLALLIPGEMLLKRNIQHQTAPVVVRAQRQLNESQGQRTIKLQQDSEEYRR